MHSVLILDSSEKFREELALELQKDYYVFCSSTGAEGLTLLEAKHPDCLILGVPLKGMDALQLLEMAGNNRPKVIITLAYAYSPYILQELKELGNGYPILKPCAVNYIKHRLDAMMNNQKNIISADAQRIVSNHLTKLRIPKWKAYKMLCVGIPLFAQDPTQFMIKEIYPAIAALCDCDNWQQVESRIRGGIRWAWEQRDDTIWQEYFSDTTQCPTNKEFIEKMAEILNSELTSPAIL